MFTELEMVNSIVPQRQSGKILLIFEPFVQGKSRSLHPVYSNNNGAFISATPESTSWGPSSIPHDVQRSRIEWFATWSDLNFSPHGDNGMETHIN